MTFTVVSLTVVLREDTTPAATIAWTLGVSIAAGILAAILVSWLLWPFIARHELRKSLSLMLYYLALIYRGVVAQYIYYEDGHEPNDENIQRSELLEGRLREGFVRLSDLLVSHISPSIPIKRRQFHSRRFYQTNFMFSLGINTA
jgi:hypothetical protein